MRLNHLRCLHLWLIQRCGQHMLNWMELKYVPLSLDLKESQFIRNGWKEGRNSILTVFSKLTGLFCFTYNSIRDVPWIPCIVLIVCLFEGMSACLRMQICMFRMCVYEYCEGNFLTFCFFSGCVSRIHVSRLIRYYSSSSQPDGLTAIFGVAEESSNPSWVWVPAKQNDSSCRSCMQSELKN